MNTKTANTLAQQTLNLAQADDYAGYDPFDGLNSRLFSVAPILRKGVFGLAWTQLFKRSPINFRPLCLVPKKRNPKGVALFILGLVNDYQRSGEQKYLHEAQRLADWLLTQKCDEQQWGAPCWGYHFDWNARAFYVPKGKPNVITTLYVAKALHAFGQVTKQDKYTQCAMQSAHFMVNHLYTQTTDEQGREQCYFAYIPGESAFVHNASLWAAAWVATYAAYYDDSLYGDLALQVARQSVQAQNEQGAWVYGTRHHHQFIDGFHTGYNLEALDIVRSQLQTTEFDAAIERGLQFYTEHLFDSQGTAKYYHDNPYPLDMHNVCQALLTLLKVNPNAEQLALADKILTRSVELLYEQRSGRFVYQKGKRYTNKVNYMRWTQAWVYYSFSELALVQQRARVEQEAA